MKKFLILCFAMTSLLSCEDNSLPSEAKRGQLQFSFSTEMTNSGGRTKNDPDPAFILLSIEDVNGNSIEEDKKIPLYTFGTDYVSESLQLDVANYKITQFMVLDAGNNVIYATPMEGSSLAQYVNDPLPINFAIAENGSTLVTPQVLDVTEQNTPEAFGYVSFGFEVVPTKLPRLKEIISRYENSASKFVYSYDADRISMIEIYEFSGSEFAELTHYFKFFHDASGKLIRKEFYQNAQLFDTELYEYDLNDKLIRIDGHNDREFLCDQGKLTEVNVFPGEFSWREKTHFNYNANGNPSTVTVQGYDSNNEVNWTTTTNYTYDDKVAILDGLPAQYYVGLAYTPTHIHDFNGIILNHNISSINTSTHWISGLDTGLHQVYSEFEYNAFGLPTKETIYNPDHIGVFFNYTGTTRKFIYE